MGSPDSRGSLLGFSATECSRIAAGATDKAANFLFREPFWVFFKKKINFITLCYNCILHMIFFMFLHFVFTAPVLWIIRAKAHPSQVYPVFLQLVQKACLE